MMDLSIVIPVLNEARKIGSDVQAAAAFLAGAGLNGEVIIVDDGSTDGTAAVAREKKISPDIKLKVIRLEKNSGKGFALKSGIKESTGDVVLFADSGTCVPYTNAMPIIQRIRAGKLDIGLASRRHKQTVIHRNRSLKRRIISWLFARAAVRIAGLPRWVSDPQCGFKVYRGEIARALFAECTTNGFLFELEILLSAVRAGLRIEEFPVEWTCDPDSRLRPLSVAIPVAKDLFRLRQIK